MIKIFIADDHAIIREGLKQIVGETSDMIIAGEAGNGHEALEKIYKNNYDVILLDVSMPGTTGLEVLKQLKSEGFNLPVLILTMHPEEQYAIRALRAGASGYLTKESAPDELIKAIRKISVGKKYITPSLAEKLALNLRIDDGEPNHKTLSDREYEVMCMIASGKRVSEIAEEFFLSPKTISTYRTQILKKMGMRNNAEIIHYAIKNKLVE